MNPTMKKTKKPTKLKASHWAHVFLEQAARETVWARQFSKDCRYIDAHDALMRRGVWLHAALLAQGEKK